MRHHATICVLILLYVSSYCYMCPHTICFVILLYVLAYCYIYVSSCCYICVLILLYVSSYCCTSFNFVPPARMCSHTALYVSSYAIYVSSYCYICALILLYMCPHTSIIHLDVHTSLEMPLIRSVDKFTTASVLILLHVSSYYYAWTSTRPLRCPSSAASTSLRAALCCECAALQCGAGIRQHTPAYASIRQNASAYASMRQHTPAYASIRQHSSDVFAHSSLLRVCLYAVVRTPR
jgi:hypothetical protein